MSSKKRSDVDNYITLHEAIRRIIIECGPSETKVIADKINNLGLYMRRDCEPVLVNQVSARISKYSYMFIRENGKIHINKKKRLMTIIENTKTPNTIDSIYEALVQMNITQGDTLLVNTNSY